MNLTKVIENQSKFLKNLKHKKKPYFVKVNNADILVYPNVFPPTTDTKLLAEYIQIAKYDKILDLTTGSGALAVIAGLQGGKGYASDINPEAVKNANDNFKKYNLNIKAIQSDLFSDIPKEQFDFIIANGPYIEGKITEVLEYAFYGARNYVSRLFKEAPEYLNKNGKLLVTFAEWGDTDFFEQTAKNNGFDFIVLGKKTSADRERVYRLYRLKLKS